MDQSDAYITLSECVYRVAAETGELPEFAKAKSIVMRASLDDMLTIYANLRFLRQSEAALDNA